MRPVPSHDDPLRAGKGQGELRSESGSSMSAAVGEPVTGGSLLRS